MAAHKNLLLIQSFRAIASLLVVFFHATENCKAIFGFSFLYDLFEFGRAGVDMFFVLSGFIITYTSFKDLFITNRLIPFLKRRIIRIYPVYWIIISFFLITQFSLSVQHTSGDDLSFTNLVATYLLLPGHAMVNGVSWTLSHELFFYLLFSLSFLLKNKKLLLIIMVSYMAVIIFFHYLAPYSQDTIKPASFFLSARNLEFFIGVIAALILPYLRPSFSLAMIITGSVLFLAGAVFSNLNISVAPLPINRVIFFGIPSFILIAGAACYEKNKHVKVNKAILSVGDGSYSLYLLHLPILSMSLKQLFAMNIRNAGIVNFVVLALIFFITYGSVLFFKYIERPLINRLKSRTNTELAVR